MDEEEQQVVVVKKGKACSCRRFWTVMCGCTYVLLVFIVFCLLGHFICIETDICEDENLMAWSVLMGLASFASALIFACICSIILINPF